MRIGELSRRSGLSRDTIRYYARRGLIASAPEASGANSYRAYSEDALLTLEWIAEAQAAGLALEDLIILMGQLGAHDGDEDFDGVAFLDRKIAEIEGRIDRSKKFLESLKQTRSALERAPNG